MASGDEHVRALVDEPLRRRQPNPAAAASHECDLALEPCHVSASPRCFTEPRTTLKTGPRGSARLRDPISIDSLPAIASLNACVGERPLQVRPARHASTSKDPLARSDAPRGACDSRVDVGACYHM